MTFTVKRSWLVLLLVAAGSIASADDALAPSDRAEALIERIRRGDPIVRDEALKGLLDLAETEDEKPAATRPVHDVLKRALGDPDAEVRFRVRRVLADPEVRVERLLVSLLEPLQTEAVRQTMKALLERADRAVARAGLVRIARKAAQVGFNPLTSKLNETWHPWGVEGGAQLKLDRRFHAALDLLSEPASDDEVAGVCELLHEDLGASLGDVIDTLAARPAFAREWCRSALRSPEALTRENAAWALGELGTAEDVPALDAALNDPEPRVRRAVVSAYAMLPVEAAVCVQAAGRANDPDPRVATPALYLGALHGHKFVSEPARKLLAAQGETPSETRTQAMRALARLGDTDGTLRAIAEKGLDGARVAVWAAGASGDQEALGTLERLIADEGFDSEPGIYYGIARAGATNWLERLGRVQRNDPRRLAIHALGSAKGDAARITELLQKTAARAVEQQDGGAADWNDFLTAFRALRDRDDEPSRKAMGVLLDQALVNAQRGTGVDDQTLTRFVEYVHQARATSCLRALTSLVRTNRRFVREAAMDALATLDAKRAREVLTPLLEAPHASTEQIQVICRSLARAGDRPRAGRSIEIAEAKLARSISGSDPNTPIPSALNTLGIEFAYGGQTADALLCYRRMRWLSPDSSMASYNIACVKALAGDREGAIRWVRRATREGFKDWRHMKGDADLSLLYDDVRFQRIVDHLRQTQEVDPAIER